MQLEELRARVAARSPVVDKNDFVVSRCIGRRVLDVGCIDHNWETAVALGPDWIHERIRRVSTDVVGIDFLADDAAELNLRGYDIRVADAQAFDLGRTFDVIVAGDLIEHLERPGAFLECAKRHLVPGGELVLTTPNAFSAEQFLLALRANKVMLNPEHVAWFDPRTLYALLDRCGFVITDFSWVNTRFHVPRRWIRLTARAIVRQRPILGNDFALVASPVAT